jgi:hypothetical protein
MSDIIAYVSDIHIAPSNADSERSQDSRGSSLERKTDQRNCCSNQLNGPFGLALNKFISINSQ